MKTPDDGIRKAAILVASLDHRTAERMLGQFTPEQAMRLRQAAGELNDVDAHERQRIIEEFMRLGPMLPESQPAGIELTDQLSPRLLSGTAAVEDELVLTSAPTHSSNASPFHFLQDAEADKLAKALQGERPQTVALVLSHLPPEQAGAILVRLEPAVQTDVVRRLVDLEETDPAVLRDVERALESRLSQQVRMQRRRVAGLKAVAAILEASAQPVGSRILQNLAVGDPALAERFAPPPVRIDNILEADAAVWSALFATADADLAVLALVGAPPATITRALQKMAPGEALLLRRRINHPGPIRLRDVEQARQELAELAQQMAIDGRIGSPRPMAVTGAAA